MNDINFLRQYDDIDTVLSPSQNNIIFGHEAARHFLAQMRQEGRLHHALIFEGEHGIGKATLAFHLAWNILSSQKGDFLQPESNSITWRQITQGSHPCLLHISRRFDVKTQKFKTGILIDDIRDIMHFLHKTSQDNGWRIVIIDPADDMNRSAANAILKTLEEPPAKTLFIIITHSSGKLLPTIRSRCQQISLRPLHDDEMKKVITHVFFNQNRLNEETIKMIVQRSKGSPRKAALLIHHGGLEIVKNIDTLLEQSVCNPAIVHTLAQTLSSLSSVIQFQQFCNEILDKIQKKAIMLAEKGNLALSKKYAQIWQEIHQEVEEMQSFNLDKKQFIINLLFRVHKIIHESKIFP
ncbi:DNA polymerase III subunit delta' [Bartonella quintana]|uniref:DNA polymerase III, delta' subunit n=1 Tax=Bartonella quintana JK 68 TaxID=1134503 RepID=A0ABR4SSN5_BARQI|nr:DNA polymerase III subunit delta' [Bartonella quintana]ETS11481.1 DNA polymerase III, delta' subunit [Bartonella quintana BQ2-D70]ETS18001.1 DNA polymerase III, delta' subunit [Bartonella quintana JK 7]ETS18830.1 DNA polymerase III, delta' subunit [Bartonella quintana JK 12]KEC60182.1 DNA polymerase III, delta' subunit [Bartonella quintana JK 19]KEC60722.1 DNA polymerase III, delta' subunit [Bartonella quintana JK 31]